MVQTLSKLEITDKRGEFQAIASPATKRVIWLDYLMVFSTFMVVVTHVSARVILYSSVPYKWWAGNILDSLSRWAMPVFIMISGYLLLSPGKEYTLLSFYKRRAGRVLIPLVVWSLFYVSVTVMKRYLNGEPISINNVFGPMAAGQPYYHLWYLYMLIGLYLVTPFLRKIVLSSTRGELTFLCVIAFVIPVVVDIANWFHYHIYYLHQSLFITWFLYFLGYYLAGYLLGQAWNRKIKLYIPITAYILSVIITAAGLYLVTARYSFNTGLYFYSTFSPTTIIMSLSIFLMAKILLAPAPRNKLVEKSALLMFGIYLMHPFFIDLLDHFGVSALAFNPVISIPIVSVLVFFICLGAAAVVRKIPYLRKII